MQGSKEYNIIVTLGGGKGKRQKLSQKTQIFRIAGQLMSKSASEVLDFSGAPEGTVEMKEARRRALTQHHFFAVFSLSCLVEMEEARRRALTHPSFSRSYSVD